MTYWPWPLNGVQDWFEQLQNNINKIATDAGRLVWETVPALIKRGLDFLHTLAVTVGWRFWEFVRDPLEALADIAKRVWNFIPATWQSIMAWWRDLSTKNWELLWWFVKDPVGRLKEVVGYVYPYLPPWLQDLLKVQYGLAQLGWRELLDFGKDPVGKLSRGFQWVKDETWNAINALPGKISTMFDGAVSSILEGLGKSVRGALEWLWSGVKWIAEQVVGFFTWAGTALRDMMMPPIRAVVNALTGSFTAGSPDPETAQAVTVWIETMHGRLEEVISQAYRSPAALEQMPTTAIIAAATVTVAGLVAQVAGTAIDTAHPIKQIGVREVIKQVIEFVGLTTVASGPIMAMYQSGIFRPLQYYYNDLFTPLFPGSGEISQLAAKRLIPYATYSKTMRYQGLREEWSSVLLQGSYQAPSFRDLQIMSWRGKATEDRIREALRYGAMREDWIESYVGILENIPGPGDLINFVVREVIDPKEFPTWMARQGFSAFWSTSYWEAHWRLPDPGRLWTAFLRKVLREDEYKKYIVWHDFKPEPRPGISRSDLEIMYATQYDLPGRIDTRWMYEWGQISAAELKELFRSGGMSPDWLDKVTEATITNVMREEIGGLITEAVTDRAKGWITDAAFTDRLKALGITDVRIKYYLAKAQARELRDLAEESEAILKEQYRKGVIGKSDLEAALIELGKLPSWVQAEVDLEESRLIPKPKAPPVVIEIPLTKSEVLTAYRSGIRDKAWTVSRLEGLKVAAKDIPTLLEMYSPKVAPPKPTPPAPLTKSEILRVYKARLIPREIASSRLLELKVPQEDVELLLDLNIPVEITE